VQLSTPDVQAVLRTMASNTPSKLAISATVY